MARWEPGAYDRLREAALTLFDEQGFEQTTVAQIAERAGLNRRTFFHHFADKREVVFAGQEASEELIAAEIAAQPQALDPLHAAVAALQRVADTTYERYRAGSVLLGRVIAASPELQERELVKRAGLAGRIAGALGERGTDERAAAVAGWTAAAVFFAARNRWNQPGNERTLAELMGETLETFLDATLHRAGAPLRSVSEV
ncbi:TetR family transcriptional regulator [Dactylosporangium vinaceum]|uniref:TetR/AcrR family transcriptional regulator n=1 Tax=Dactylosporangium vinaceum TaxID=53362 RepID=A0ABV5M7V7_9ACTN|nr:TetR/AcrR family transcriptional regulator [Dactylosporangium vinaceum]UAB92302.1 TetR family transcriptional regulator [Dactylosporangium vinaceum]